MDALVGFDAANSRTESGIGSFQVTLDPEPVFLYQHGFDVISPHEILPSDNKDSLSSSCALCP